MKIAIGSDHAAYELKEAIKEKMIGEGELVDISIQQSPLQTKLKGVYQMPKFYLLVQTARWKWRKCQKLVMQ